ncbi:MAG: ABC transporter ATP-binding protein [Chloroflexota bacterium]
MPHSTTAGTPTDERQNMARVTINDMTKKFGRVTAVDGMSLDIADREFMVLLGPSGAGKTTTLRCVAGLETPEEGNIRFDDESIDKVSPALRDVAFVFQSYALYPRKSVYENIASPLMARKVSKDEIDRKVREVAQKLHIESKLERKPAQLSGGEQQRVALCRAMVRQPRVFLMDEPLTNLDFKLRVEMRTELKHLHADLDTTFFYVTNDQLEALSLADRIAVLNNGLLQQVDTPENVYEHPANRFVASFIGSPTMNFLDCALTNDGTPALAADGWSLTIPDNVRDAIKGAELDRVVLGVRSEDIALRPQGSSGDLDAEVFSVEPLGDRNIYDVQLGSSYIRVKTAPTVMLDIGDRVRLNVDRARIHLFHPKTDRAIM